MPLFTLSKRSEKNKSPEPACYQVDRSQDKPETEQVEKQQVEAKPTPEQSFEVKAATANATETTTLLVGEVDKYWKEKTREIKQWIKEGPLVLNVMCFLVCLFCAVAAPLCVLGNLASFHITKFIMSVYVSVFSLFGLMLEADKLTLIKNFKRKIEYWCKFLERRWGRGIFYVMGGTMQIAGSSIMSPLQLVGGLAMLGVGALSLVVGWTAGQKLGQMYAQIHHEMGRSESEMRKVFDRHDKDKSGKLEPTELAEVAHELSSPLDRNELAAIFALLDLNQDGGISFEEFRSWWQGDTTTNLSMV